MRTASCRSFAAHVIRTVLSRHSSLDPARVADVVLGCANQAGEDNRNVARMALLLAGLPVSVPGETVNRLCASGMSAVANVARSVKLGEGDLYVAGGLKTGRIMAKDEDVCLHCGLCAERCPTGAWDMQKTLIQMTQAGPACRSR